MDSVTRRGDTCKPVLVGQDPQRLHRLVVVVKRLAHAHQDDIEARVAHVERVGEHADLTDDFAGGQVPHQPHLAGQAERQAIAQPTWVEMQKVIAGVSGMNTDSIWRPSARREQEFFGAVDRRSRADDLGRRQREIGGKRRAERAATGRSCRVERR